MESSRPNLRVIQGKKDDADVKRRRLGEQAMTVGTHWAGGQIGARGERRLINEFRQLLPGLAESVIRTVGPVILTELGDRVASGEDDTEAVILLAHIFERQHDLVQSSRATLNVEKEIEDIRRDLQLISQDWKLKLDPEGHHIDVVAQPRRPTGLKDDVAPQYNEVAVATTYLEEPISEMVNNAMFVCRAPTRIQLLLDLLEGKR